MTYQLEQVLSNVQKPARYVGGEYKQVIKDKDSVNIRVALCFPDTYEIGMSNLGFRIIYGVLNSINNVWCERVFSPWIDMEEQMRSNSMSLYGLESYDPIKDFDIIAFSIGYELSYTNVLNMLDLAGLPLRTGNRGNNYPLVIAGGVCTYNPEPLSDFIDLFVIGEGEELILELVELACEAKLKNISKHELLLSACKLEGIYIPKFYNVEYNQDNIIHNITTVNHIAKVPVKKRLVKNFDNSYFPVDAIVPSTALIHDRVVLELFRGCIRGCRFCQAGFVNRPVRSRSTDVLIRQGIEALSKSGYDELALLSLSTSDYENLIKLCDGLMDWCEPRRIGLSLPSLRVDNFNSALMHRLQKVRKAGLTFAPEAGTQRLRDVINKNITEEDLLDTCRIAFEGGWNSVKLYFMLGLPTETDEDVLAIAGLTDKIVYVWRTYAKNKNRGLRITVSTSCFIPKPHTPFQWEMQIPEVEYLRRVDLLKANIKSKAVAYNWHSPEQSVIEAILARGDRRLGDAIEAAWKNGAAFDSWTETFLFSRWLDAFNACNIDPTFYTSRKRSVSEVLPWSIISSGVSDEYLISEREAAYKEAVTPDCRTKCSGCGMTDLKTGVCYGQ